MAFTTEQQAQVDMQIAVENARHNNQMAFLAAQVKMDAIRIAQQILIENSRSKPADEREITPTDIATFASALTAATNG